MSGIRSLPMIKLLTGLLLLAWPFVIWFGLAHNGLHWLLPLMALLLLLRLRQTRRQAGPLQAVTQLVAVVGIALCVASFMLKTHQLLLFYPVVVNAVMLAVFGGSLWSAMPIVERLARLQEPDLPERACAIPATSRKSGAAFSSLTVELPSLPRFMPICRYGPPGTA